MGLDWNAIYAAPDSPWKGGPSAGVEEHIGFIAGGVTADLGCGDGREALFIAGNGGTVYAYDISEQGIRRLIEGAETLGVAERVHAVVMDIAHFKADREYRTALSSFALHFLPLEDGKRMVSEMQSMVEPGGLNLITDFCEPFPTDADRNLFYVATDAIRELYAGWEILSLTERLRKTRQLDDQGNPYMKKTFQLVARKPGKTE